MLGLALFLAGFFHIRGSGARILCPPSRPRTHFQPGMQHALPRIRESASMSDGLSVACAVSIVVRVLRSQQAAGTVFISRGQRGEQFVSGLASAAAQPGRKLSGTASISASAGVCVCSLARSCLLGADMVSSSITCNLLTFAQYGAGKAGRIAPSPGRLAADRREAGDHLGAGRAAGGMGPVAAAGVTRYALLSRTLTNPVILYT